MKKRPLTPWFLGLGLLAGCVEELTYFEELTSLRLTLREPQESALGRADSPVRLSELMLDVQAIGPNGQVMPKDYTGNAFLTSGGQRLSMRSPCEGGGGTGDGAPPWLLSSFPIKGGKAENLRVNLALPPIFGEVAFNIEEPRVRVIGATPPIFLPNPTIADLMKPENLDGKDASYCARYLGRQVVVDRATGNGKLVVSSLFQNGFTVTDTGALDMDGKPAYGSLYVFTFSRPSTSVRPGKIVTRLSGAIAQFNKAVQVANPSFQLADGEPQLGLLPKVVDLTGDKRPKSPNNSPEQKELTKYIGAQVKVTAKICTIKLANGMDDPFRAPNWYGFNTFVVSYDDTDACDSRKTFSVQLPGKGFGCIDPVTMAGRSMTFTGMLRNSATSTGSALFWTVVVRDLSDLSVNPCMAG